MGPAPLTWADIAHWCALTGHSLRPWEVDALKRIDTIWLRVQAERQEGEKRSGGQSQGSKRKK